MAENLRIIEEFRNGIRILRVQNMIMLNPEMAEEMTKTLVKTFETGDQKVLINLGCVARMSSLFFRSFIIAGKKAKERKAVMAFCNIESTIKSGFEMMGLNNYFIVYPEETEALDKMK